jgi:uracil-DNA glycosylase
VSWPEDIPRNDDLPERVETVATVHPSAVLRDPEHDVAMSAFVDDLRVARRAISEHAGRRR